MICEVCGKSKRDLLLRPIECDCCNKYVKLEVEGDHVISVNKEQDKE